MTLNSQHSTSSWAFPAKKQEKSASIRRQGICGPTNVMRFLLHAGQGDQISPALVKGETPDQILGIIRSENEGFC